MKKNLSTQRKEKHRVTYGQALRLAKATQSLAEEIEAAQQAVDKRVDRCQKKYP